jgi:hypothetical protein
MWCEGGDQALFTTARSSKEISHQLATKKIDEVAEKSPQQQLKVTRQ